MSEARRSSVKFSAFRSAPDFARGLMRDMRVRWACEEIGKPYEICLIDGSRPRSADYRLVQPFDQVPAFWDQDVNLFESGAILLYLAEKDARLLPRELPARAKTISWMFAALNTIEPPLTFLVMLDLFVAHESWSRMARPTIESIARQRLEQLSVHLGNKDWLEGLFTVADLLMVSVLRNIRHTNLLDGFPNLTAYRARGEGREAFSRALASHLADTSPASTISQPDG